MESNSSPLSGVRVLEFGGYIAVPLATSILSGLGADVIKIEKPGGGDDFRRNQGDRSPYFRQYNAGKRSLAVDLKKPAGVELVKALISKSDIAINNLRPGKMAAIGLSYEACLTLQPNLVYVSVTGYGNGGPLVERPAYDTMGQAVGGLYTILSDAGEAQLSGTIVADLVTALSTATGVLAALVGRNATGTSQLVETSVMEAMSTMTIDAITQYFDSGRVEPTRQSRHPQAQNFCLKTAGGEDVAIHLSSSQKFWRSFTIAIARPELADNPRYATYDLRVEHYFELAAIAEEEFAKQYLAEWESRLTAADVPYVPVLTMSTYLSHPQTDWLQIVDPEDDDLRLVRLPWRLNGARPTRSPKTPVVGGETREIAAEVIDPSRVDELFASGVLYAEE